ncbi:MAG: hypothetical protein ACEPOZ_02420 [Marinifilaceae bacterium]
MTRIKSPIEITRLLNSALPEEQELGYQSFLGRTHWLKGNSPDDLCRLACTQLQLNPAHIFVNPPRIYSTTLLWASQDRLEADKLSMVESAYRYIHSKGADFPPIVVWNFYQSSRIKLVIHDGHHRAWFFNSMKHCVNAVVLEPISHYAEAEARFRQAFQIRKLAVDLPIY